MYKLIMLSPDELLASRLGETLESQGNHVIASLRSIRELVARLEILHPELLIVLTEAPDTGMLSALNAVQRAYPMPIVMFATRPGDVSAEDVIAAGVTTFVVDGLKAHRVGSILDISVARFRGSAALHSELQRAKEKLAERKIIERAKGLLMNRRGLNEEDAYTSLRKLAMDQNKRIIDVAEGVIDSVQLLG